jgi:hypothetical protein
LEWTWDLIYDPISSIKDYVITVENWREGSSSKYYSVKNETVNETRYVLTDNIKDGYRYKITVTAISGSGLEHSMSSKIYALVDLTIPMRPTGIYIENLEYGSREYIVSWIGSIDRTIGGILYYEVWSRMDEGDWNLYETTEKENLSIERPIGHSLSIKVRAVDISFHYSDFSDIVQTDNQPPMPEIMIGSDLISGAPIELTTPDILDPDGCIIRFSWYVDGRFQSDMRDLRITLHEGRYTITLRVTDDQYAQGIATKEIEIIHIDEPSPNTSLNEWLEITSDKDIFMPEVNVTHYDNRSVIIHRNETSDEDLVSKEVLTDLLLLFTGVPLMVILVFAAVFLFISEVFNIKGYREARNSNGKTRNGRDMEKEMILNNFLSNPNISKVISYRSSIKTPKIDTEKTQQRSKIYQGKQRNIPRGLEALFSSGFKSAPSIKIVRKPDPIDIEVEWDENDEEDIEEWEEVEAW